MTQLRDEFQSQISSEEAKNSISITITKPTTRRKRAVNQIGNEDASTGTFSLAKKRKIA